MSFQSFPKHSKAITSKSKLDRTLWDLTSKIARITDARNRGDGEYVVCISCGKVDHWKNMDAGHFISRRFKATKFHLDNIHCQCRNCNFYRTQQQLEQSFVIDRIHGDGAAERLYNLSRMKCKLTDEWYENEIELAREKLKKLL
jgi:hypothetical protein